MASFMIPTMSSSSSILPPPPARSSSSSASTSGAAAGISRLPWRATWAGAAASAGGDDSATATTGNSTSKPADRDGSGGSGGSGAALQMAAASEWRVRQEFQQFGREVAAAGSQGREEGEQQQEAEETAAAALPAAVPSAAAALCLNGIRDDLIRQEDSIIFALIERAQFQLNGVVYKSGTIGEMSLLEFMLRDTEAVYAKVRRYTAPGEVPFFPASLPPLLLPPFCFPQFLYGPAVLGLNHNPSVLSAYLRQIVPAITEPGDDGNYGSVAMYDTLCLQHLSKRIHYGMFVAEAKFQAQESAYTKPISEGDGAAIMELLTDEAVEARVLARVRLKAATFGQDIQEGHTAANAVDSESIKLLPEAVAEIYKDVVMPLTKEVQVDYLLKRLGSTH